MDAGARVTARPEEDCLAMYLAGRDAACPACGYALRDVRGAACPECGRALRLGLRGRHRSGSIFAALIGAAAGWGFHTAIVAACLVNVLDGGRPPVAFGRLLVGMLVCGAFVFGAVLLGKRNERWDERRGWRGRSGWGGWGVALLVWGVSVASVAWYFAALV